MPVMLASSAALGDLTFHVFLFFGAQEDCPKEVTN